MRRNVRFMRLLERDGALVDLRRALADACRGEGRVALVGGGAGFGKTSLVRAFVEGLDGRVAVLEGECDDLLTPRPFGPLHDVARTARALAAALAAGESQAVFVALLDAMADPGPRAATVLVVEDGHWADEATLDALTFLTRRIHRLPALLVLTYRDDEITSVDPLQRVLGGLRAPVAVRVELAPLTVQAVAALAGEQGSALRLHALTGGNPFFVTELLAAEHEGVPSSVSQGVLARTARLPERTRALLELLAVVPARAETALLDGICPAWPEDAAPAEERGILIMTEHALAFRHELARRSVEQALPVARARRLHQHVLGALRTVGADPARLVHHAERAGDTNTLAEVAPVAARAAAAAGAHREAVEQYRRALNLGDHYPAEQRADLLEAYTREASATCLLTEAMQAAEDALALREAQADPGGVGRNLRWMSWLSWLSGQREQMERRLEAALEVLETQPPGPDLALAYADLAVRLALYGGQRDEAEQTAGRAVALAEASGDSGVRTHVLTTVGIVPAALHGDDGPLRRGLEAARDHGHHLNAGVAYEALAGLAMLGRDRAAARHWIAEGIDYLEAREIEASLRYLHGLDALHRLDGGDWTGAESIARWVLARPQGRGITEVHAFVALARLQTRRGQLDEARSTLRELWTVAETCGLVQHVGPAAAALGEHAWLTGDWVDAVGPLRAAHAVALRLGVVSMAAELGFWLGRSGEPVPELPPDTGLADPFSLQAAGDPKAAAEAWHRLGHPYERAFALADTAEPDALLIALEIADGLGAAPLAARTRAALRALGVTRVPRGPQASTRAHPAGLTPRQVDVLELIENGLTDAEIAERLVLSVRTVNHHVAAVLEKLGVDSRRDAARAAARLQGAVG
jgi:DNA-binding CsgD family transcriptional regulator/tetratricopeptide (TPR) repeat protein